MAQGVAAKSAVVKLDNSAGSLTDVSAYVENFNPSFEIGRELTTTLGASSQSRVLTLKDGSFSIDFVYDRTGGTPTIYNQVKGIYGGLSGGGSVSFDISPEGTTSGYPKFTGEAHMVSWTLPIAVGDKLKISAQFECTGDVTFTTN